MPKPLAVCLGDIHLDTCIWRRIRHVQGDAYLGLKSAIDVAIKYNVPFFMVGDIFDSVNPDTYVIREIFRPLMDLAESNGVPVYFIQGNHDKREIPWPCAVHTYPVWLENGKVKLRLGDYTLRGLDYMVHDDFDEIIDETKSDILLIHQAVKQCLPFDGKWNADLECVNKDVKLVVMGDIHQEWECTLTSGAKAYYTGPGHARDMSQAGPKSVLIINDDLSISREPIPSRVMVKKLVTSDEELNSFKAWVDSVINTPQPLPPFTWVICTPDMSEQLYNISSSNLNNIVIHKEIATTKAMALQIEEIEVSELRGLEDIVPAFIDRNKSPEAFNLVLELLSRANDPKEVIMAFRDRIIS
jgi:hypothetical protein